MSNQTLYLIFFGGLVPLMFIGYIIGKARAVTIRSKGIKMHSQPDQYGWFVALYTGLPIITIGFVGVFLYLFGIHAIPPFMLVAGALSAGAIALWLFFRRVDAKTRARDSVENFIKGMLLFASLISVMTTFGILLSIIFEALHFFQTQSVSYFLFGLEWSPDTAFLEGAGRADAASAQAKFGAVPIFAGTFYITIMAMILAVPVGLMSAIFMSEYATPKLRAQVKPFLEILAGIPTVVYGFFAALTIAPAIVKFFALFGIEAQYQNALSCGIIMGVMIIPFISSLSDDVISSVPQNMRNGAYALGMNKAETIRFVVLPSAMPGIIASILLAVSRALGETMIVVMAAGLRPNLTWNPLEDMTTVTVKIVESLTGDQEFNNPLTLSAFALGFVLFVVTLIINIISVSTIRSFHRKYKVSTL